MNKFCRIIFFAAFMAASVNSYAGENSPARDIVFFPVYTGNPVGDVILKATADRLSDACAAAGRFVPVEYNLVQSAFRTADGKERYELYKNAAAKMDAGSYVVITIFSEGKGFRVKVEFFALSDELKREEFEYSVYASAAENIPLKAAREFYHKIAKMPLYARVLEVRPDGTFILGAGQWHGVKEGIYDTDNGDMGLTGVSRYTSRTKGVSLEEGDYIAIYTYNENEKYISAIEEQILENTIRRYGTDELLDKRKGGVRELFLATCLVNQGASFCVPGYGSYLSMEYLGIENAEPDKGVITLTLTLTTGHLILPSCMTWFDINFFPWEMDSDKTKSMQRFQYFLWATIPVTFTVSYYSQLADQYRQKGLLPPVFEEYNITALILSTFIPGGGLFYKGYSASGWGLYFSEMSLAGCAVYLWGSDSGMYCAAGFALVKAVDLLAALILDPSYEVFEKELARQEEDVTFAAGFVPSEDGSVEMVMSLSKHF